MLEDVYFWIVWGGFILVLDDGGRLDFNLVFVYEDFVNIIECEFIGNFGFFMKCTDYVWHAVRAIECFVDWLCWVFIVVVNFDNFFWKVCD